MADKTGNAAGNTTETAGFEFDMLYVVSSPTRVEAYTTFGIILASHTVPVGDDEFTVYRKTTYKDEKGEEHKFPVAGKLSAKRQFRSFTFSELMFFDLSFDVKAKGLWNLEFELHNDDYGKLCTLKVPIVVD
jgi:hypothetical protein